MAEAISSIIGYRTQILKSLQDSVTLECMTVPFTLNPCGHVLSHNTIAEILICPSCRTDIQEYVPNYTVVTLLEITHAHSAERIQKEEELAENTNIGYLYQMVDALKDRIRGDLMREACTVFPCGHVFNKHTVTGILSNHNKKCPLDARPIASYVPNYTICELAEITFSYLQVRGLPLEKVPSYCATAKAVEGCPAMGMTLRSGRKLPSAIEGNVCQRSRKKARLELEVHRPPIPLIAFGRAKWLEYLGEVGEEPPLPPNIDEILQRKCLLWDDDVTVEFTHWLVLIPATVDGVPFTLDLLGDLIQHPKKGFPAKYGHYPETVKEALGVQPVHKSYWILMTRNVIPGSKNKSYTNQEELVHAYATKARLAYRVPSTLEAATSILLECMETGLSTYAGNPWKFTNCKESIYRDDWWNHVTVGPLNLHGLSFGIGASYNRDLYNEEGNLEEEEEDNIGVAALWQLNV